MRYFNSLGMFLAIGLFLLEAPLLREQYIRHFSRRSSYRSQLSFVIDLFSMRYSRKELYNFSKEKNLKWIVVLMRIRNIFLYLLLFWMSVKLAQLLVGLV